MSRKRITTRPQAPTCLSHLRVMAGLTQKALAEKLGTHQPTISAYEMGMMISDVHSQAILDVFADIDQTREYMQAITVEMLSHPWPGLSESDG